MLRIFGDDLIPAEITKLMECDPTTSYAKGDVIRGSKSGREIAKKTGMWGLSATDCAPENIDAQVSEVLAKLPSDLALWEALAARFEMDLFCGLFMENTNEGSEISAGTLFDLGARRIKLSLDVYGPIAELRDDDPCPCGSGKTYGKCCAEKK
jgi:hypothetical protein